LKGTDYARATATGFILNINDSYDCNAKNVVYLLECIKCQEQYIGETENFRKRMNNHRSQCLKNKDTATYIHRMKTGHGFEDFSIVILKGGFRDADARRKFESLMIRKFDVMNRGMNLRL
jgi:hypothetical protein